MTSTTTSRARRATLDRCVTCKTKVQWHHKATLSARRTVARWSMNVIEFGRKRRNGVRLQGSLQHLGTILASFLRLHEMSYSYVKGGQRGGCTTFSQSANAYYLGINYPSLCLYRGSGLMTNWWCVESFSGERQCSRRLQRLWLACGHSSEVNQRRVKAVVMWHLSRDRRRLVARFSASPESCTVWILRHPIYPRRPAVTAQFSVVGLCH